MSQPIESRIPYLQDQIALPDSQGPGPTFLSTTSTPSPPSSPTMMMKSAFPNPLRSNPVSPRTSPYPSLSTMPLSPPSTVTSPYSNLMSPHTKQHLPTLTPLPLSPLTLKPSTKPPLSLDAPNPTTRENFSPTSPSRDFPADFPVSGYSHRPSTTVSRLPSHSASVSLTMAGPSHTRPRTLKHRSPSQPHLPTYFTSESSSSGPPTIPLRMSSIPTNNKPRKLSLPVHRSTSTLKQKSRSSEEKENIVGPETAGSMTPRRVSPPLRTNKELPSPPLTREEEMRTREKVKASSPKEEWSTTLHSPHRSASDSENRQGRVWTDLDAGHPGIAELPAAAPTTRRVSSHSRLHSAPVSSSFHRPYQSPDVQALTTAVGPPSKSQPYSTSQPFPSSFIPISTAIPSGNLDDVIQPTAPVTDPYPHSKAPNPPQNERSCRTIAKHITHTQPHPSDHHSKHTSNPTEPTIEANKAAGSRTGKAKNKEKNKSKQPESAGEGRPAQMSKSQRDKDRKKRSKAKVLIEHVDIIKDEFWEKRPWILSGKTG